ncbi:restriction endonuclease [Candidatus Saccharibacteria bacterium]|nr:restriction endonuclease [Candidatus Saccharibacteria bacterium]MBI3338018.1 restriction endonuclease [Candidatus Saccharibacteria bacterium]
MDTAETKKYVRYLTAVGSISKLFSNNTQPYLYYRLAENIFVDAFGAQNVGRSDIAIDAVKDRVGYGLKTFVGHNKGSSYQKIAEFNAQKPTLDKLLAQEEKDSFMIALANLRNSRIKFAIDAFQLNQTKYHSVVRDHYLFSVIEEPMHEIDLSKAKVIDVNEKTIIFNDQTGEYKFVKSKSTLYKRFYEKTPLYSFKIDILNDPLSLLIPKISGLFNSDLYRAESIILPLYSTRDGEVPERSGLNQWNADGRPRSKKEVYIPVPSWLHTVFPDFLPERSKSFVLTLPSGKTISCSVVQDGGKAIMSNPNTDLGEWLIDGVLKLPEGQIVTKHMLDTLGIDSVELSKENNNYSLNFKKTGSYEKFKEENNII